MIYANNGYSNVSNASGLDLGYALGAGINAVGTYVATDQTNKANEAINAQNIAFQKQENAITRSREDNAIQRAAADMKAAGLSQTLAAGQPAGAQNLTAPRSDMYYQSPLGKAIEKLNLANSILEFRKNKAEVDHINSQTNATNVASELNMKRFIDEHALNGTQIELYKSQIALHDSQTRLNDIAGEYKAQEIEASIDDIIARTSKTNADKEYVRSQILTEVKKRFHLDAEMEMLAEEIALNKLKQNELKQNLTYAETYGLPVGHLLGGQFGGLLDFMRSFLYREDGSDGLPNVTPDGVKGKPYTWTNPDDGKTYDIVPYMGYPWFAFSF